MPSANDQLKHQQRWESFLRVPVRQGLSADQVAQWAAGRPAYAVWLALIDDESVLARVAEVAQALAPWCLPGYLRQPHITIAAAGFPTDLPVGDEDYGVTSFTENVASLQALAMPAFDIQVGGANSFGTAPYLEVYDVTEGLRTLQGQLCAWTRAGKSMCYLPHITVGMYQDDTAFAPVHAALTPWRELPALTLPVRELTLAVYAPAHLDGGLLPVYRHLLS